MKNWLENVANIMLDLVVISLLVIVALVIYFGIPAAWIFGLAAMIASNVLWVKIIFIPIHCLGGLLYIFMLACFNMK